MSQVPLTKLESETTATSSQSRDTPPPKQRSCVVCRTRKVRCDKQSPCSNCRRGNIACVFPPKDRPPRWAHQHLATSALASSNLDHDPVPAQLMEKITNLESLVRELRGQLEIATKSSSTAGGSSAADSPESLNRDADQQRHASSGGSVQQQFGRLVIQDANRSRYISSGFWSRVNDEIDGLELGDHGLEVGDYESSDEEEPGLQPVTQEIDRTPADRHAFLFRHNLEPSAPALSSLHPLPSQIPFLFDMFCENVNSVIRVVHNPTIAKLVKKIDITSLTPANEALMFSIYYAAISSMDDDEVLKNFGFPKTELSLKYRTGLERALANADFLNVPDLTLIQAFGIFVSLVKRHDSPRFVWMMTGLLIRMGQALGLHRDGSHFEHLTPYEIHMRRCAWWGLYMLDMRAAEDQGSEFMISIGSFDTKLPININDADISPESTQMPEPREGITDLTFLLVSCEMGEVSKEMIAQSNQAKDGLLNAEEQDRLVMEIFRKMDQTYLQYSRETGSITHWVAMTVARLVMAKMTLFVYLPILFTSLSGHFSDSIKNKLLVASIEIAEYNHALNEEQACKHWRWVYQTYTHWYATVYLLIETSRRPWSPIAERAWVALHSPWLCPPHMNKKNIRIWVPLRKLMIKARQHRDGELERLRSDLQAAQRLEMEDQNIPVPGSSGLFPAGMDVVGLFRERWRQLIGLSSQNAGLEAQPTMAFQPTAGTSPAQSTHSAGHTTGWTMPTNSQHYETAPTMDTSNNFPMGNPTIEQMTGEIPVYPTAWATDPNFATWPLTDADLSLDTFGNFEGLDMDMGDANMDLGEMDWYSWVETNKNMEWDLGTG